VETSSESAISDRQKVVNEMKINRITIGLLAVGSAAFLANPAAAQTCDLEATSSVVEGQYDPFSKSSLPVGQVTVRFKRRNDGGGAKTSDVNFYFTSQSSVANGTIINLISEDGPGSLRNSPIGQNIYQNFPGPVLAAGTPLPSPQPGVVSYQFGGDAARFDDAVFTFNVTLPPGRDFRAGAFIPFDIVFACAGQGGGGPFSAQGTLTNRFSLNVTVKSGLQARYSGQSLSFGEVGDKTDAEGAALAAIGGTIRVASSGPYTISLASEYGYQMTYSAAKKDSEDDNLRYQVSFLGETRSPSNFSVLSKTCSPAGIGRPNALDGGVDHSIFVRLLEGGATETPSANTPYRDLLTVTVTPLAADGGSGVCP
jgi:spore coat protein U-like protein